MKIQDILYIPRLYTFLSSLLGNSTGKRRLLEDYIQTVPGNKILDLGCGPANIISSLPSEIEYTGIDNNPLYIKKAREKYACHNFECISIEHYKPTKTNYYDRVLALGVLHHLEDPVAQKLITLAYDALKPGGYLITYDGVWLKNQSFVAKLLLSIDRGNFIRTPEQYLELFKNTFRNIKSNHYNDCLKLPYNIFITKAEK